MATTATKSKAASAAAAAAAPENEEQKHHENPKPPPRTLAPPPSLPNLARLRQLAAAFAPVLRLHPDDAFRPCSAAWFASRSSLWDDGGGDGGDGGRENGRLLARLGECSLRLAVESQRELGRGVEGAGRRLRLALDPLARGGQELDELDEKVPLYVRAHLVVPPPQAREREAARGASDLASLRPRLEITYLALYAFNGPYFPFLPEALGGPGVGAHDGDLERVTVRLDAETGEMVGCFFSAHRPRDGGWAPAREIERYEPPKSSFPSPSGRDGAGDDDGCEKTTPSSSSSPRSFSPRGRIVAYVAKHGHGTYPTSGTQLRAGFLANDRTSSRGTAWAPRRLVLLRAAGTETMKKELEKPKPSGSPPSSSLSPVAALLESSELGITVCRGCELETPSSSSSSPWTMPPPTDPAATGVSVEAAADGDDDSEVALFGEFEGKFGEVLAARSQGWWSRAECPVSRGVALRLMGQFWPEKESLHR